MEKQQKKRIPYQEENIDFGRSFLYGNDVWVPSFWTEIVATAQDLLTTSFISNSGW